MNVANSGQSPSSVKMSHVMKNESRVVESLIELQSSSVKEDVSSINDSLKKELNKFWD